MYINLNEQTIYYEKHGVGKKQILILPGWGNTRETFYHTINYFKSLYTIYIIDYPGLGNSPIPKKDLTIYNYTEIVIDFMETLNIKNPIIIAHSFGGRITTLLTSLYHYPVDKQILIDIAGIKPKKNIYQKLKEKTYKLLKRLIKLFPEPKQRKLQQKLINKFASNDYQALPITMQQTFKNIINEDLTSYYQNIKTESLLIWGENDEDTPLKDGKKINSLISSSALIIIKNAKHFPYLQYPYLINNIINEFIK